MSTARPILPKAPTGINGLDEITGGGLPKGRPTLICGGAGCGKTLMSMEFLVRGATELNEPGVFVAFEETTAELTQNVASLGFDLDDLVDRGLLALDFVEVEPSELANTGDFDLTGLFIRLGYAIDSIGAKRIVIDTIETLFIALSNPTVLRAELRRLFRWLKGKGVTAIITGERSGGESLERTDSAISSLIDTWLLLRAIDTGGERNRALSILKSRGMAHSNQTREFLITARGIELRDVYLGPNGVLTGSARLAQESAERIERMERRQEIERRQRDLAHRRALLEAQIAALQQEFQAREAETLALIERVQRREAQNLEDQASMASSRRADTPQAQDSE